MIPKKQPNPIDKHAGARVRMRRMMLGKSQEWLADQAGLTFQQIQKYEKGTNRISCSRLAEFAMALGVAPAFFFEGAPGLAAPNKAGGKVDLVAQFFSLPYGTELAEHYVAIGHNVDRRAVVDVARSIASGTAAEPIRRRA